MLVLRSVREVTIDIDHELIGLQLGLRDGIKHERIPRGQLPVCERLFADAGFVAYSDPRLLYEAGHADIHNYAGRSHGTLFVARDRRTAERLAELSIATERRGGDSKARAQAEDEIGALLGYPACCRAAFRSRQSSGRAALHLAPLHRTRGPLDQRLNRFSRWAALISHIPCRFDCPDSIALAASIEAETSIRYPATSAFAREIRSCPLLYLDADQLVLVRGEWSENTLVIDDIVPPDPEPGRDATIGPAAELRGHLEPGAVVRSEPAKIFVDVRGRQLSSTDMFPNTCWWVMDWTGTQTPTAPASTIRCANRELTSQLRAQGLLINFVDGQPASNRGLLDAVELVWSGRASVTV